LQRVLNIVVQQNHFTFSLLLLDVSGSKHDSNRLIVETLSNDCLIQ